MIIKIEEDNWAAEVLFSPQSQMVNFMHCSASITGKTEADALAGAKTVLDLFAKGREAFIRIRPEAMTEKNFDTKAVCHLGYVRFSVKIEPGEWYYPTEINRTIPLGLPWF